MNSDLSKMKSKFLLKLVIYFSLEQDNINSKPFDFKQKIWFLKIGIIGIEISCLISRRSRIRTSEARSCTNRKQSLGSDSRQFI